MSAREVAADHARTRARLAAGLSRLALEAWQLVDPRRISETWAAQIPRLLLKLTAGQYAAASTADRYLTAVLAEQDLNPAAAGAVNPAMLAGIASDGRPLDTLLAQPGITAKVALSEGATLERAMASGQALAELIAHTQVADAGRVADQVALTTRPAVAGYRRMVVGKTCSRCIVLAGKYYRWNAGFRRHPRCDCIHVPAAEDTPDEIRTDPMKVFGAMSPAEQDRVFTRAGAQAIRDGGDISQVVNARRGARGLTPAGARLTADEERMLRGGRDRGHLERVRVRGHDLFITTEGRTVRGVAGKRLSRRGGTTKQQGARYSSARAVRLMPESIYELAGGDRTEAIRLLRVHGYII